MKPKQPAMRLLIPIVIVTSFACQPGDSPSGGTGVHLRDSAGIRITENAPPPGGSRLPWRIGAEPAVTIGRAEGDEPYLLYRVLDALRLADGRIVVLNGGTQELRVFDGDGTHLATWGGSGDGPGEFRSLWAIEPWRGDSIAAWYGPRRGITLFAGTGSFGRNIVFERDENSPAGMPFNPKATGPGGAILVSQEPHNFETVEVQIRDPEGRIAASLGTHPGDDRYIANEGTERATMYYPPFSARAVQKAWGDLFVHASTGQHEIRAHASDGSLARIVRLGVAPRVPTQAHIDAYIDDQLSWIPPELPPDEAERYLARQRRAWEAVPPAEFLPAFNSMIADRVGHLWLEEFEPPGEERPGARWTVLDPEGRVLGWVETPDGLEIYEIGADYLLGDTWDEFGLEYVQLWSLERQDSIH